MRISKHIGIVLAAASLASAPGPAPASTLQVLHPFGAPPDGSESIQPLIVRSGILYGTTCHGGTLNQGTAFMIMPSGAGYMKLHDFDPGPDGTCPSDLKFHGGKFYGTTMDGGFGSMAGAIFQMLPASPWTVTALYGFGVSANDGQIPRAGVIFHSNKIYGTTQTGTPGGEGTVFRYDFSTEFPLHSFNGADGAAPKSALVYANGSLWGTTTSGTGAAALGTVFRMNLSGTITWQYAFTGGSEGANPSSRLLVFGSFLYGVAQRGGAGPCLCGTIYKVDLASPTAALPVYSFAGEPTDGALPSGNLAQFSGILFGTTESGGSFGSGTVYGVDANLGTEPFAPYPLNGASEGAQPKSGLVRKGAWFYGTASAGGSGGGTIFRFQP